MFAAAARLGVTRNPMGALRHHHMGIFLKRRHPRSGRHLKSLALKRDSRLRLRRRFTTGAQPVSEVRQPVLEFAAENCGNAELAKIASVHRRLQAVTSKMSAASLCPHQTNESVR